MKDRYLKDNDLEAIESIYGMCGKELIRQVSVHCKDRGELLKEIFEKQPEIIARRCELLTHKINETSRIHLNELEDMKIRCQKEIEDIKQHLEEIIQKYDIERAAKDKATDKLVEYKSKVKNLERHRQANSNRILKSTPKKRKNTLPAKFDKLSKVH